MARTSRSDGSTCPDRGGGPRPGRAAHRLRDDDTLAQCERDLGEDGERTDQHRATERLRLVTLSDAVDDEAAEAAPCDDGRERCGRDHRDRRGADPAITSGDATGSSTRHSICQPRHPHAARCVAEVVVDVGDADVRVRQHRRDREQQRARRTSGPRRCPAPEPATRGYRTTGWRGPMLAMITAAFPPRRKWPSITPIGSATHERERAPRSTRAGRVRSVRCGMPAVPLPLIGVGEPVVDVAEEVHDDRRRVQGVASHCAPSSEQVGDDRRARRSARVRR